MVVIQSIPKDTPQEDLYKKLMDIPKINSDPADCLVCGEMTTGLAIFIPYDGDNFVLGVPEEGMKKIAIYAICQKCAYRTAETIETAIMRVRN